MEAEAALPACLLRPGETELGLGVETRRLGFAGWGRRPGGPSAAHGDLGCVHLVPGLGGGIRARSALPRPHTGHAACFRFLLF